MSNFYDRIVEHAYMTQQDVMKRSLYFNIGIDGNGSILLRVLTEAVPVEGLILYRKLEDKVHQSFDILVSDPTPEGEDPLEPEEITIDYLMEVTDFEAIETTEEILLAIQNRLLNSTGANTSILNTIYVKHKDSKNYITLNMALTSDYGDYEGLEELIQEQLPGIKVYNVERKQGDQLLTSEEARALMSSLMVGEINSRYYIVSPTGGTEFLADFWKGTTMGTVDIKKAVVRWLISAADFKECPPEVEP